eukprot:scaffold26.g3330.t1
MFARLLMSRQASTSVWELWQAQRRLAASVAGISAPSSTNLWDVVKREHFEKHNAQQVADIWMEFHADPAKHRVAKVMAPAQFLKFSENAARSPNFVLPVFRGPNAFENFMVQCQLPYVLFTTLEQYKRDGPAAAPHFAATHYMELMGDKGLVLVRGDVIQPGAVSRTDAEALLRLLHEFYTDDQKHGFVWKFNHMQSEFDFKRMLDSLGHDTSSLPRA